MKRVGPAMALAVAYVARHPGCRAHRCAKAIGPHGSAQFGALGANLQGALGLDL